MNTWNSVPHVLQSLVLGTLIEVAFIAVLRVVRGRFPEVGPTLDRIGPKAIRDPAARRTSVGCTVGLAWFILSWWIGHEAIVVKRAIIAQLMHR